MITDLDQNRVKNLRRRIREAMLRIRATTPRTDLTANPPWQAKGVEGFWPGTLDGHPTQRVIIYLRSSGCDWAIGRPQGGLPVFKTGCLDCVHSVAGTTFGVPIPAAHYVRQFEDAFAAYDTPAYTTLCLYNEGNFYNEGELPREARVEILRSIGRRPNIRAVVLETLPRFLNDEVLAETRELLGDREVEIGIGLESSDPVVRDLCVNKPYTLEDFEAVVPLVQRYRAKVLAYILLRPAFLTEREALSDALETARYADRVGVDILSIEPINLSDHNMSGVLGRLGLHRAPWLWSVFEFVRKTYAPGRVRIGGDQYAPTYHNYAHNCEACTDRARVLAQEFNRTDDPKVLDGLACDCRAEWEAELNEPAAPLLDRIDAALDRIARLDLPMASP